MGKLTKIVEWRRRQPEKDGSERIQEQHGTDVTDKTADSGTVPSDGVE